MAGGGDGGAGWSVEPWFDGEDDGAEREEGAGSSAMPPGGSPAADGGFTPCVRVVGCLGECLCCKECGREGWINERFELQRADPLTNLLNELWSESVEAFVLFWSQRPNKSKLGSKAVIFYFFVLNFCDIFYFLFPPH